MRWVEAGEIQRRIAVGQKIWSPVVKPKEIAQSDKRIDPKNIETWFFGALTGDGSTYINDDKGRSRSITFTKGDLDVVRLVKRACFELSADVVQFGPIDYRIINCKGLRQRIMDGGGLHVGLQAHTWMDHVGRIGCHRVIPDGSVRYGRVR